MYEDFDLLSFLVGLPLAIVVMVIVFLIMRRIGKKRRWFDERYIRIHEKARSLSWLVTTITILIVWMIIIVMEGPSFAFFLLTGIWVVHMSSYGIGAIIANKSN
ncbi:DUF3796 domain-containing protein [Psychrobacillus vulpis]|uniref:DUF3796 domain-containing protein n=1 Tax=Psychrobacillus vulpis TaxID=2325572 RepID=A0A544TNP0_9BACI|nr:DUF3796 domain-containing protein [Psychrobacillus vulpis]TQR19057.1 DUF3796 domain-containing protein [Psychrobacillus vulpis]